MAEPAQPTLREQKAAHAKEVWHTVLAKGAAAAQSGLTTLAVRFVDGDQDGIREATLPVEGLTFHELCMVALHAGATAEAGRLLSLFHVREDGKLDGLHATEQFDDLKSRLPTSGGEVRGATVLRARASHL